jgi:serine kinase of HPr protein (carbohydrate metabolism regulator)
MTEQFQQKWEPVLRPELRKNKEREHFRDSKKSGTALVHATALILGDRGLLIQGDSGAGKSTLALSLIRRSGLAGRFARLVGDDQIDLVAKGGRLVAKAPATIAGLVEVHGLSPTSADHEAQGVIDLVIRLVKPAEAPRFQENGQIEIEGCRLPALHLAAGNVEAAANVIHAWFGFEPFPERA